MTLKSKSKKKPPKPKPMPRRVNVRLSNRDYLALNRAAIRNGLSLAAFLRERALAGA